LWLRDSMNQVLPYMRFARDDAPLQNMLCGLVRRQTSSVLLDPWANSFNFNASGQGNQDDVRQPPMTAAVYEGKYELDSLAAFLKLSRSYWEHTGDEACFEGSDGGTSWLKAVDSALRVIEWNQQSTAEESEVGWWYMFQRETVVGTDTLMQSGRGPPAGRCGLSKSYFRASDDGQTFPFHIPANAMAVVELRHMSNMLNELSLDDTRTQLSIASQAEALSAELASAIEQFGIMTPENKFAYEVDGEGSSYFMDDANVPSLLSLPYLGFIDKAAGTYQRTRAKVLSPSNPFFFNGTAGQGVGGPHVGFNAIWPMSIIMRALTALEGDDGDREIMDCLDMLKASSNGSGFLHESFDSNNVSEFTRSWFSWVNGLFGELIIQLLNERPWLVLAASITPQ